MRVLAVLVIWMIAFQAPVFLIGSELKHATISELEALGEMKPVPRAWDPRFWDILVPETHADKTKLNHFATVPEPVKEHALSWARRVIKPEWLPANLGEMVAGVRDVNQDKKALIPTGWTTDILIAEYEIDGFNFRLVENGLTISLRVEMPPGVEIGDNQESIGNWLKRFLNLDLSVFDAPKWTLVFRSPIFYGGLEPEERRVTPEGGFLTEWWDNVCWASDGTFLFASVREVREGVWMNVEPDWQPRPPDRF